MEGETEAESQTPFQIYADDVKAKYADEIKELSPLEVSRKIAFLWTKMTQAERRRYYERAGKHVDKSLSAKIRVLPSTSSEIAPESGDPVRAPRQQSRPPEPKEPVKKPEQESNDSDEDEYVAPRRGGRRGKGRKVVDHDWDDFEDNKPRRRGARRRKVSTE